MQSYNICVMRYKSSWSISSSVSLYLHFTPMSVSPSLSLSGSHRMRMNHYTPAVIQNITSNDEFLKNRKPPTK